jgi:BolA protein
LTNKGDRRIALAMNADQSVRHAITKKLHEAFAPESLDVTDESHLHEGHAGHRPGGETHFRVYIVSPAFKGKSRIERHRMINATLAAELAGSVHALAIKAQAPGES